MKNATAHARRFASLLRQIRKDHPPEHVEPAEPITQLVVAFLEWNASRAQAAAAHQRLLAAVVDHNDLRVSHPLELVQILGEGYPLAQERSERLHEALHDIYMREQGVTLDDLGARPKREVREYLGTLHAMVPYVAAQVTLLCFGGHAVPVDDQLARLLVENEAAETGSTVGEIESFLERNVKMEKAIETHAILMAWVDATIHPAASSASTPGGVRSPRRPADRQSGGPARARERSATRQ